MVDGKCTVGWAVKGKYSQLTFNILAGCEFFVHYVVHMTALVYFYGNVIRISNKTMNKNADTTSANTQKVKFFPDNCPLGYKVLLQHLLPNCKILS